MWSRTELVLGSDSREYLSSRIDDIAGREVGLDEMIVMEERRAVLGSGIDGKILLGP